MVKKYGIKAVALDYIQKIPASCHEERMKDKLRIDNALSLIHGTCQNMGLALIVLAQLSREADKVDPHMGHLSDTSIIEKDADYIVLMSRDGEKIDEDQRLILDLVKNREGKIGKLSMNLNNPTLKFTSIGWHYK